MNPQNVIKMYVYTHICMYVCMYVNERTKLFGTWGTFSVYTETQANNEDISPCISRSIPTVVNVREFEISEKRGTNVESKT
jgi:hypothetical protein